MRILVVEDESEIAAEVASAMREAGFAVESVCNGEDAWLRRKFGAPAIETRRGHGYLLRADV